MKPGVVLKKIRSLRVVAGALFSLLMIFSFQNCAPQQNCAASSSDCSAKDSKTTNTGTRPSNNTISLGGSGSSSGGGSSGSGNTISIGGGSGGSSGGSSGGGWSNSGGSSSGSSGSSGPLQFTAQPSGVSVIEQANFQLSASVGGGTYPYTYLWYKDGVAISDGTGNYSIYMSVADSYNKQGNYYLVVRDGAGASIQSNSVRVTVTEPAVGCPAGSYFTFTDGRLDQATNYIGTYFDGPQGKFLLSQSFDTYGYFYQTGGYIGLTSFSFGGAMAYQARVGLSCTANIPRIHAPTGNPGGYYDSCYEYQGQVIFECHNKKLKFVADTCQWVRRADCSSGSGDPGWGN